MGPRTKSQRKPHTKVSASNPNKRTADEYESDNGFVDDDDNNDEEGGKRKKVKNSGKEDKKKGGKKGETVPGGGERDGKGEEFWEVGYFSIPLLFSTYLLPRWMGTPGGIGRWISLAGTRRAKQLKLP